MWDVIVLFHDHCLSIYFGIVVLFKNCYYFSTLLTHSSIYLHIYDSVMFEYVEFSTNK